MKEILGSKLAVLGVGCGRQGVEVARHPGFCREKVWGWCYSKLREEAGTDKRGAT